eukprot:XP_011672701.1 PREDICTED: uncharacterized protein LOC105442361 [Strongylocentrotus purpuratus]
MIGFRVLFKDLSLYDDDSEVQIGTGNDPSEIQSIITTFHGYRDYANDVYVDSDEMWLAVIGAKGYTFLQLDVEIISIDLSTLFDCSSSNMSVSPTVLCDGLHHCDHYEDELACNNSATYLHEGESHLIYMYIPYPTTSRLYNATLLQTNATKGFQVVFQDLYLYDDDDEVQIGTGNDPSDIQSVITTIHGYTDYADDVYVDTDEIWLAVIGGKGHTSLRLDVEIIPIDLSTLFDCLSSNMSVSPTVLCDGLHHCDHYEDELECNNENPVINVCPSDQNVTLDSGNATAVVTWTPPSATDNSGNQTLTSTHNSGEYFPLGNNPVTYTSTDSAGNTGTCTFFVVVSDNENPVINVCPSDQNVTLDSGNATAVVTWTPPSATDNSGNQTLTSTHNSGEYFPLGNNPVTYTSTDSAGNTGTCTFFVVVSDNENPVINVCPSDQNVTLDSGNATAVVTWTPPSATDNSGNQTLTSTHNSGEYFPLGNNPVTYTSTDSAGNTGTCTFFVVVSDNENPVINVCPSDQNVTLDSGNATAVVTWTPPTATDNSGIQTLTSTHNSGEYFPLGNNTVTFTSTDSAGNTGTCTFFVVVSDDENPVINVCPSDQNVTLDSGNATAVVTWTPPTATDNSGYQTLTSTHNSGEYFPLGNNTVTYTSTDSAGNIGTCTFFVVVSDDENPVVNVCPSDQNVTTDSGNATAVVTWTPPTATDTGNSGNHTLTSTHNSGEYFPLGNNTVTYTSTDFAGNTRTCTFFVVVSDDENPVINVCPSDQNVTTDSGNSTAVVTWTPPTATDNSGYQTLTSTHNSGEYFPLGNNTVTYTSTDSAGNTKTCTFFVVVSDTDECSVNPSSCDSINGMCINSVGSYICSCNSGYELSNDGITCNDIEECSVNPSICDSENGMCMNSAGSYICSCNPGYELSNDGITCNGIADPCTQPNLCVNGVCSPIGQGQYECECQDHYDGIYCDESTLPLEVSVHPSSQIVNINANVELTCSFNNAKGYYWYKDDVLLPNSENQNPLIILSVSPSNIGYYFCRGSGRNGATLDTMPASVYVKDLTNIKVLNARFAISFRDELYDQTSKLYRETAFNISTFVQSVPAEDIMRGLVLSLAGSSLSDLTKSNITINAPTQDDRDENIATRPDTIAQVNIPPSVSSIISSTAPLSGSQSNGSSGYVRVNFNVQSVPAEDIMRGLVLSLAGSSLSDLTKSNITINAPTQDDRDENIATRPDTIAQVNIPPSVSSIISSTAPLSGSQSNGSSGYVRVNFNVFSTPALFISKSLRTLSADNEGFNRSANSPVISLSIGQGNIAALTESINFTFTTIMPGYMNPIVHSG